MCLGNVTDRGTQVLRLMKGEKKKESKGPCIFHSPSLLMLSTNDDLYYMWLCAYSCANQNPSDEKWSAKGKRVVSMRGSAKNRKINEKLSYMKNGPGSSNPLRGALLPGMTRANDPTLRCSIDLTSLGAPTSAEHSQTPVHSPTVRQRSPLNWILTNREKSIL